jgi:hypothetical protein
MKFPFSFVLATSLLASLCFVTTVTAQTILDVVVDSPNHSTLARAISVADPEVAELLSAPSASITLFALDYDAVKLIIPEYLQLLFTPPYVHQCKYHTSTHNST